MRLTVDLILEQHGVEVLGRFIRNTIDQDLSCNPWVFRGAGPAPLAFLWRKTPEGYEYWREVCGDLFSRETHDALPLENASSKDEVFSLAVLEAAKFAAGLPRG